MSDSGDYLLGLLGLAVVVVSITIAGRTLRRALLPGWSGASALLATAVLAVGMLVVISEALGLVGLLDGVLLVAACAIAGGAALRIEPMLIPRGLEGRAKTKAAEALAGAGPREAPAVGRVEIGIAVAIALLVAAQWAGPTLLAFDRGIYGGDSLWYHMPFAAHIAQSGSVTELLFIDPLYVNWFYPENSELLHADGLLLLGNDFLSPLLNLAWLGLALVAGWCIGRPYGAGAPAMAAVAALMSANLLFSRQPGNANNDVVAIALLLAAIAVLVNARRPTASGALLVGGLAAGLALGTKLTVVPPVAALTIGLILIAAPGARLRAALAWGAGLIVGGGLWYVRDLFVAGTPFPFVDLGPLDKPEELAGREPFSIAHYLTDTDVWGRFFTPALQERFGDLWPLLLAAAVIAVALWLWRGDRLERMLAAVALVAALAYLVTPLSASGPEGTPVGFRLNIRYLAPGLALALVLAAIPPPIVRGRELSWRAGALGVFAVLIAISAGAFEQLDTDRVPGSALLALAVVGLPLAIVWFSRRGVGPVPLAAAAVVAVIGLAVIGRIAQEDYLELRYSSAAPDYPRDEQPAVELGQGLGGAFDIARDLSGERIGLSGTTGALFQYGLWGHDSSNRVRYIGQRGDRGSFEEIPECPEWTAAVNAGDYDYMVSTPAYDQDNPESAATPVESLWLRGSANARHLGGTGLVDVWELSGPLDPRACVGVPSRGAPTPGAPAD